MDTGSGASSWDNNEGKGVTQRGATTPGKDKAATAMRVATSKRGSRTAEENEADAPPTKKTKRVMKAAPGLLPGKKAELPLSPDRAASKKPWSDEEKLMFKRFMEENAKKKPKKTFDQTLQRYYKAALAVGHG